METLNEPLNTSILAIMYFGDVVFAISGALTVPRHRTDILGFLMIGTITRIGGVRSKILSLFRWQKPISSKFNPNDRISKFVQTMGHPNNRPVQPVNARVILK